MRKLGVAVIGFFCGLLVGTVLTEVIARITLGISGHLPGVLALPLGCLMPLLALAGVVVALVIDDRAHRQDALS
jgi:hypothetical protein